MNCAMRKSCVSDEVRLKHGSHRSVHFAKKKKRRSYNLHDAEKKLMADSLSKFNYRMIGKNDYNLEFLLLSCMNTNLVNKYVN